VRLVKISNFRAQDRLGQRRVAAPPFTVRASLMTAATNATAIPLHERDDTRSDHTIRTSRKASAARAEAFSSDARDLTRAPVTRATGRHAGPTGPLTRARLFFIRCTGFRKLDRRPRAAIRQNTDQKQRKQAADDLER
jgi:hypothetical protein